MRDRRLELVGVATILAAGGIVWLMHHPEAPILDRAAGWPLVGPAARALIDRFRPPPPVEPPPEQDPVVEYHYRIGGGGLSSASPARGRTPGRPAEPEVRRFASFDAVEPVGPLPAMPADPRHLEAALSHLGPGPTKHRLGPYALRTDLADVEEIVRRWRPLVADSERAWTERYGVAPLGNPVETIVLFARGEAFSAFARESGVSAREPNGFASRGIVALAADGRLAGELDASFQHELAHLLARRSIGPALPPWLAEGLAEDFGETPLGEDGQFDFERVRGDVLRHGRRFEIHGGLAALDRAGRMAARGSPPALWLHAGAAEDGEARDGEDLDLYADAFVWIRFLLADPRSASGVREFLAAARGGAEPTLSALEEHLDRPLAELAPAFTPWLLELRRRELVAHGAPSRLPDEEGVIAADVQAAAPES